MKKLSRIFATALTTALAFGSAVADEAAADTRFESPLALALAPCAELPSADADVTGLRLGLVARHHDVSIFDLNVLAGLADGCQAGLQLSGFYNRVGSADGLLQFSTLANDCSGDFTGAQLALIYNRTKGVTKGVSLGFVNLANQLQGMQFGLVNRVQLLEGLQVGIANYALDGAGVQIGIINIFQEGRYPAIPFFNYNF